MLAPQEVGPAPGGMPYSTVAGGATSGPQPTGPPTRGGRNGRGPGQRRSEYPAVGPPLTGGKRRVLLLNATFEPLTALPLRRAVVLVVCGKAEVVHGDPAGLTLHAATVSVPVPSVIRLSNYVRVPYRAQAPLTRAGLMHRDRFRCAYCGGRAETIDHVVPRSRGGQHTWENCVACCAKCNHRKADRLLSELGWRLRTVPRVPHGPHWRLLAHSTDADPQWRQYLGIPAA
ncbi:5-methylcytosine-specific restriction endonuclease McrA [Amycolatopsis arida]|uniref:5-methylcytosine-specific restriction endonuclease McrA n=1 Tax=Amycolatopsis arida TaxID=587909 RepID=A0A1I5ULW3_9PSEU|nr:HNH endonuclease [Amycolatopsis arida]TDX90948.1 5-methylcytosine-specific restriction endonuclease McrA [Amycolatopsis arida]SFP96284.1 5-methylcytosine-specific restriction endonuclease McrA [Amycolatopsis arida]